MNFDGIFAMFTTKTHDAAQRYQKSFLFTNEKGVEEIIITRSS
jgi:hypothetical protein